MRSIILQGYSYPPATLADVIAAEARQGRTARIAIQHAGGWAVADMTLVCSCWEHVGDDEGCPVHGKERR